MLETDHDLDSLDTVIQESIANAGPFLRESFQMPEHSLSARQISSHLKGIINVALATTTSRGHPRVAPIGALFVGGCFFIPTVLKAARCQHIRTRPAVSLTYYEGVDFAVIAHGTARIVSESESAFRLADSTYESLRGQSVSEWGEGVYIRLVPERLFSFARYPERFAVHEDV